MRLVRLNTMKIVVISGVIFPRQSPRSFRATELAKFFARKGHDVTLYAVLGKYDYHEFEKTTGVHVRSLGKTHFPILNSDGYVRNSVIDKLLVRLFGNLLEYPDIELMWKTKNTLRQLNDIDLLVTIAVPFPIHWGAAWAKKKYPSLFPKVWVSDCGDPYMGDTVNKTHPAYFQKIEDFWGDQTDYISIPLNEAKMAYSKKVQEKLRVIPQGFDFSNVRIDKDFKGNIIPRFAYAGSIIYGYRDPSGLLNYLCEHPELNFEFVVYTKNYGFFEGYKMVLGEKLTIKKYVPREQLLWELSQMDFLVNIKNKSSVQSPSKLIDYYLTERPILDITTEFVEFKNFEEFLVKNYKGQHIKTDISKYDINNVGQQFLKLLE